MTSTKAVLIVLSSALLFALAGSAIGYGLGVLVPSYYRNLYTSGDSPNFDAVQMGLGLGITQGFSGGIVVGLIVVFLLTRGPKIGHG